MISTLETNKGMVTIRTASLEDAHAYKELRLRALREAPTAFSSDYEESRARPERTWTDNLRMDQLTSLVITVFAFYGEELIGMASVILPKSVKIRHSATLVGVYMHHDWRGLHIADALCQNCEEWARLRGASIIKLGVTTTNTPAVQLYTRLGYKTYGQDPQAIRYKGIDYDELLMSKNL